MNMMTKALPLLLAVAAITGCASIDSQRYASLDPNPEDMSEPMLVVLSAEQKAMATKTVASLLEDTEAVEFSDVYGAVDPSAGREMVVCGSLTSDDPRGGPARSHPFAFSGKRAMILDEATNWGPIKTGREVTQPHRQRAFVGSWWAECRSKSFAAMVAKHEANQRTIQAQR